MNIAKNMNLTKYRWVILAASCLINLCIGSLYAWSVFAGPLADHLSTVTGTTITSLAIVFTIANSVGPITMISGGAIMDKLGPKWVIMAGGVLFGSGMILSGFAASVPMVMIGYGLGVGLGVGMVYGCTVSNTVKFFPDRRGLAGGATTASYGISSVLVPPVANLLINHFDVTLAFKILGIAMMVIICIPAFLVIPCPKEYKPDGWEPSIAERKRSVPDKNWKAMLKDPLFYIMILTLSCGAFSGLMVISQASLVAQRMVGMSVAAATTVVSFLALNNTVGRILAGTLSDKIGAANTIFMVFILSVTGLLLLYLTGTGAVVLFYIAISIVGIGFGSIMGIFPGFTAMQFGAKNNSVNYGIMFIGFATAGIFGPMIMSYIFEKSGSYQSAFIVAAGLALTGIFLISVYKKMTSVKKK
jgi:MFS transporter, OFA family, oxalate/formate antiporter